MLITLFFAIQVLFFILIVYLTLAFFTGAPFVPTTNAASEAMMDLISIKKGMTIYDLGSGDGKLLFLTAERGAKSTGFEINPLLVILTNIKKYFHTNRHLVACVWRNFWKADLTDADIIFIYLLPWRMAELERKILSECRKGTLVVSNSFIFPGIRKVKENREHHVYVFRV